MKVQPITHPTNTRFISWLEASLLAASLVPTQLSAHDDDDLSVIPPGPISLLVNTNTNPVLYGKVGPLIVMHAMSVHNTMVWKTNEDTPKVLMFQRHSGYRADEVPTRISSIF
jgi:hypothetical protein